MPFIDPDFLLQSDSACLLYHEFAHGTPIIDYHCHLPPQEVAEDQSWENIAQVWLAGDHYKWRALRANGIDERLITGGASDREKFNAFAASMPWLLRNPLYHWSHLELSRFFGFEGLLNAKTADAVWDKSSEVLQGGLTARQCMKQWKVEVVCTTDDPIDDLKWHAQVLSEGDIGFQMRPTWRPDKAINIADSASYNEYIGKLESVSDISISTLDDLMSALENRHAFFAENGCKLSDYGLSQFAYRDVSKTEVAEVFAKVRSGSELNQVEIESFQSYLLVECGRMDAKAGWTRQLHIGPMRNNSSRMMEKLGPDSGFDSIGELNYASELAQHLNALDRDECLGRTIVYNLNPKENEMLAALVGNFQGGGIPGKMQFGSGWWFMDQMDGMLDQMNALSQIGLLSRFVGMLTDSRSFLSYTRHEYFRRILCNMLGEDIEKGILPKDYDLIGDMVENICYKNAHSYFGFYDD
ncbi:glucuronate isomerase [Puniceicoccaceae bacterium K14]|nr:glucuronate isomerase [Puniceicoccaceae bacterium K14]